MPGKDKQQTLLISDPPKVSVIVPVYRVERYLPACLDSLKAQTMKDVEFILVDDGSPDRCGETCEEYAAKDPRFRVFHTENHGLSGARNYGMEKARGEYDTLRKIIMHNGTNDIEDTTPSFKTVEDDGAYQLSKEEASQLAQRQYKFIQNLEAALVRIENKTYGIDRLTGELIPKERLRLVPHATLSVASKDKLAKGRG